jgi:23S rRNA pseudouridine955/2504/2580 synthase
VETVRHVPIRDDDAGQRLDNFLVRLCRGVPKSHLYRLIRSGQLRVNGKRQAADYRLQAGDSVRMPPIRPPSARAAVSSETGSVGQERVRRTRAELAQRLPVLHEDESLLAIDKPASVAVHGGSGVSSGVIEQLRAARPQARFLELVHRLDRETSGVLLVARRRTALVGLHAQLRERGADKRYLAIVAGRWPLRTRTLAFPLHRHEAPDGDRRVSVQAGGQEAVTRVTGLLRFELPQLGEFSLVEARPETGRTHQIRVHLAHAGCPIVGDPKYGRFELNREMVRRGFRRMYLHAHSILFRHPDTGRPTLIEAPLPEEFAALLRAGAAAWVPPPRRGPQQQWTAREQHATGDRHSSGEPQVPGKEGA